MEEACRCESTEIGRIETTARLPCGAIGSPLVRDLVDVTAENGPRRTHGDSLRLAWRASLTVSADGAGEVSVGFRSEEADDAVHDGADECHEEDQVVDDDLAAPVFFVA